MPRTPIVDVTDLVASLAGAADVIRATPAIRAGRRYPTLPVNITLIADEISHVHAAAATNGTRVMAHLGQTYTEIEVGSVLIRFAYMPTAKLTPVDVTGQDEAVHA